MFHGMPVTASSINRVLVEYTFFGDTDFNGVLNFDDDALIDLAFNNQGGSSEELEDYVGGENLTQAQLTLPGVAKVIDQLNEHGDDILEAIADLLEDLA